MCHQVSRDTWWKKNFSGITNAVATWKLKFYWLFKIFSISHDEDDGIVNSHNSDVEIEEKSPRFWLSCRSFNALTDFFPNVTVAHIQKMGQYFFVVEMDNKNWSNSKTSCSESKSRQKHLTGNRENRRRLRRIWTFLFHFFNFDSFVRINFIFLSFFLSSLPTNYKRFEEKKFTWASKISFFSRESVCSVYTHIFLVVSADGTSASRHT